MAGDDAGYEIRSARTVRGMEARTISKWEKDGWEFVTQSQDSLMRSTLSFRRPRRKKPSLLWVVDGAVLVAIIVIVGVVSERREIPEDASALSSAPSTPTGGAVSPSAQASAEPAEEPEATSQSEAIQTESAEPEPEQAMTVKTSQEFAALLAEPEPGSPKAAEFAAKHAGKLVAFDGNIADMVNRGSYDTRYDMLIRAGDYSETSGTGPNFKFEDVSTFDLSLSGANVPDQIGERDNLRLVARILEYNSVQELFFLEPVSTEMR